MRLSGLALGVLPLVGDNLFQPARRKRLRLASSICHFATALRYFHQVFSAFADAVTAQKKPMAAGPNSPPRATPFAL